MSSFKHDTWNSRNLKAKSEFPFKNPIQGKLGVDSAQKSDTKVSFHINTKGDGSSRRIMDLGGSTSSTRNSSPFSVTGSNGTGGSKSNRSNGFTEETTFRDRVMDPQKAPLDERVWVDYVAKDSVWTSNGPSKGSLLRLPRLPTWEELELGFMHVDFPRNISEKNFYVVDYKVAYSTHILPIYVVDIDQIANDVTVVLHLEPDEDAPINISDRIVKLGHYCPVIDPEGYKAKREGPPIQGVHYYLKQAHHFSDGNDLCEIRLGYRIGEPVFPLPKSNFIKANPDYQHAVRERTIFGIKPSKNYYPMLYSKNQRKKVCKIKIIFGEPPLPDNGVNSPWYPFNFNKADCINGDPFSRRGMVQPTAMKCPYRRGKRVNKQTMRMTDTGIYPEDIFCEFGIYTLHEEEGVYYRCDQDMGNRRFEVPDALRAHEINFDHYEESVEFEPYLGRRELKRFRRVSKYPWKAVLRENYEQVMNQRRKFVEQLSLVQGIDCCKLTMVGGVIYWYYEPYETHDHSGPNQRSGGDHELARQLEFEQQQALDMYNGWKGELESRNGDLPKYRLQIADELNIAPFSVEAKHLDIVRSPRDYAIA